MAQGNPRGFDRLIRGYGQSFDLRLLARGENVVDVGSGAGTDSLIAARMVGLAGHVIGVDMTPAMLAKARRAAADAELGNVEFRERLKRSRSRMNGRTS